MEIQRPAGLGQESNSQSAMSLETLYSGILIYIICSHQCLLSGTLKCPGYVCAVEQSQKLDGRCFFPIREQKMDGDYSR